MDKKLVCPCGLTCCDCLFYKTEIYETAAKLKQLIKNSQLDIFLTILTRNQGWEAIAKQLGEDENKFSEYSESFKKLPEFFNVLDNIIKLQCTKTCRESGNCSIGGVPHKCEVVKCVESKKYEGCWECSEFKNCDKLLFLKRSYGETIEGNFQIIKEKGIESLESRGNKYYEWQRKINQR
ncbi:MAG: DUF3795 domain-containing protein [bacterium]|nr:DUF3795 domain-containing protein [bacterium]